MISTYYSEPELEYSSSSEEKPSSSEDKSDSPFVPSSFLGTSSDDSSPYPAKDQMYDSILDGGTNTSLLNAVWRNFGAVLEIHTSFPFVANFTFYISLK